MNELEYALKRMGVATSLYQGAIQFNSVTFRVVCGVLGYVGLDSVAISASIEKTLNGLLEIPTGIIADRYGRAESTLMGIKCIILALTAMYLATLTFGKSYSTILIYINGLLLGIATPLISGAMAGFYQSCVDKSCVGIDELKVKHIKENTFTLSKVYGKYIPLVSVLSSFISLYLFEKYFGANHLFIIGILFYGFVHFFISNDVKHFGDQKRNKKISMSKLSTSIKEFFGNSNCFIAMVLNLCVKTISMMIIGFYMMSLGSDLEYDKSILYFSALASFLIGCFGPGWIFYGQFGPALLEYLGRRNYQISIISVLITVSAVGLLIYNDLTIIHKIIFSFALGSATTFFFVGLSSISNNLVLSEVKESDYATMLSIMGIIGLLASGLYSFIILKVYNGIPSVSSILWSTLVLCGVSVVASLFLKENE